MAHKISKNNSESHHTSSPDISSGYKDSFFSPLGKNTEHFFEASTIQPKLEIGEPDDPFEKQADRVADSVIQKKDSDVQLQQMEEDELQMKREPILQRKCKECEEKESLQKKAKNSVSPDKTSNKSINQKLQLSRGTVHQLTQPVQKEMNGKIGADFANVNIHTDSNAAEMSRSLGARAFTHGSDIYFNSGEYNPSTKDGKHLLAHELTHVVQQGKAGKRIQREPLTNDQRRNYVTNIIAEMGTTHSDYNDGAQDADQAISAAAQANADLAKALFSISMAIIVPGFGGVVSSFATRLGITLTSSVADRIGGVIGEATKIAGENAINNAFQSTEQNQLFIAITNGLEESARVKREYLLGVQHDSSALPDRDLVELYDYWLALGRLDLDDWNQWFQAKYNEYQQQIRPIGEQTDQRYGANKLRWIEGASWRALALTGEGRYFMTNNRPTFMAWISPFYREVAVRRHEQTVGTNTLSAVHYTHLETSGGTTRSDFENILDSPYSGYNNITREQAQGNLPQGSGSYCPSCHGQGGGIGPDFNQEPLIDFSQFERNNRQGDNVDTELLRRWIEATERE